MGKTRVALLNMLAGQIALPPMERSPLAQYHYRIDRRIGPYGNQSQPPDQENPIPTGNYIKLHSGTYLGQPLRLREATPAYLREAFSGSSDVLVRVGWAEAVYIISHIPIPRYKERTWEAGLFRMGNSAEGFRRVILPERKRAGTYGSVPEHLYGPLVHDSGIMAKTPTITISREGEVLPTVVDITRTMGIRGVASVRAREGIVVLKDDVTSERVHEKIGGSVPIRGAAFGADGWASPRLVLEEDEPVIIYSDASPRQTHLSTAAQSRLALTRA